MTAAGVLRVKELFDAPAIMRLHVAKLSKDAAANWAMLRMRVYAPRQVAEPVDPAATAALQQGRKRIEADCCWRPNRIETPIRDVPRVRETSPKCFVLPLKKKIGHGVENRILINGSFLELYSRHQTKSVLIVLKNGAR